MKKILRGFHSQLPVLSDSEKGMKNELQTIQEQLRHLGNATKQVIRSLWAGEGRREVEGPHETTLSLPSLEMRGELRFLNPASKQGWESLTAASVSPGWGRMGVGAPRFLLWRSSERSLPVPVGQNEKGLPAPEDGERGQPSEAQPQPQQLPEEVHPGGSERGVSGGHASAATEAFGRLSERKVAVLPSVDGRAGAAVRFVCRRGVLSGLYVCCLKSSWKCQLE